MRIKISMPDFLKKYRSLRENRIINSTLLGIGPMSVRIARAAMELARDGSFPLMFIASRNQVDCEEVGRGYVNSWTQDTFAKSLARLADETGFEGPYYICRDHGGPWQRDEEKNAGLPEGEAMKLAELSYLNDLLAGFDMLHIDPTKDPHIDGVIPQDIVISRTISLIEYIEAERKKRKMPPVTYEVGTEETNGGLTEKADFDRFIRTLCGELDVKRLPRPDFVVGQTGTLVRLTDNVGTFNPSSAKELSEIALTHGLGLKEHNADYLDDKFLIMHPPFDVSAINVAPEFGVVESRAYLKLSGIEKELFEQGLLGRVSGFSERFIRKAVKSGRWRKWMTGERKNMDDGEVLEDERLSCQVAEICGHYIYGDEEIGEALTGLFANLERIGLDAENYVLTKIKNSISRYCLCLNLDGVMAAVIENIKGETHGENKH